MPLQNAFETIGKQRHPHKSQIANSAKLSKFPSNIFKWIFSATMLLFGSPFDFTYSAFDFRYWHRNQVITRGGEKAEHRAYQFGSEAWNWICVCVWIINTFGDCTFVFGLYRARVKKMHTHTIYRFVCASPPATVTVQYSYVYDSVYTPFYHNISYSIQI